MKYLLRLIPVALLATIILLFSLISALTPSHRNHSSVPLTRTQPTSQSAPHEVTDAQKARSQATLTKMPLLFERNQGQFAPSAEFVARGEGMDLSLDRQGATLSLMAARGSKNATLRMTFVGGRAASRVRGERALVTKVNYLVGRDSRQWRTGITTYERVVLEGVYPGVNAVYYGNGRTLEYDFLVAPGADTNAIRLRFRGADALRLNSHGDLVLRMGREELVQHAPVVYQDVNGRRVPVAGHYALRSSTEVGFAVGSYDHTLPLVIDPTLAYSTYIGPESTRLDVLAVGADGSAYIGGQAFSATVAGKSPARVGPSQSYGLGTVYVAKLNPAGNALVYVTYIGGTQGQDGNSSKLFLSGMSVDSAGNAYCVGRTNETDFPVTRAFQNTISSLAHAKAGFYYEPEDAYLLKLNSAGNALLYSTYLGGSKTCPVPDSFSGSDVPYTPNNGQDRASNVVVDNDGNAYLTGSTKAVDFPVVGGFQTKLAGGENNSTYAHSDAFVARIDTTLSGPASLVYSSYIGGYKEASTAYDDDTGYNLVTDGQGTVYVAGLGSKGPGVPFPVKGGLAPVSTDSSISQSAFVAHVDTEQTGAASLLASTLLEGDGIKSNTGSSYIELFGIALDAQGEVYVAGSTPFSRVAGKTPIAFGTSADSDDDCVLVKMKADLSALSYAIVFGGSKEERVTSLAVDAQGQAYAAGTTLSEDFVQVQPVYSVPSSPSTTNDFLVKVSSTGTNLVYSTLIGGTKNEDTFSIAPSVPPRVGFDAAGSVYVAGNTYSSDFPTTEGALQATGSGGTHGFVLKLQAPGLYVNSTDDGDDVNAASGGYDGACSTGKTLSDGQSECTLRAAIQEANHSSIKPTISFRIKIGVPVNTVPKIVVKKSLPPLIMPMIIDGTTQQGIKRVQLDGTSAGTASGLIVDGGGSTITGLVVSNFKTDGILLRTKGGNTIQNCFIGTDAKGTATQSNGQSGIHAFKSPANLIGGTKTELANVISGNTDKGVWIEDSASTGNIVQGNLIGTNLSGSAKIGKQQFGVYVGPAAYVAGKTTIAPIAATIGGTVTGASNVISGNTLAGINTESASGCTIQGNFIGTDKAGLKALGNGDEDGGIGISLAHSTSNQVGGTMAGARNVASGNVVAGIRLFGAQTSGNHIEGNFVGTDRTGLKALGNGSEGISLLGASGNFIGGPNVAQRNIIAGNKGIDGKGVGVSFVVERQAAFGSNKGVPSNNLVRGNYIGTDASGAKALPNAFGALVGGGAFNTLQGNLISGNSSVGVVVTKGQTNLDEGEGTTLADNLLGTDPTGTKALPNGLYGVMLISQKNPVLSGNTISGNGRGGVMLAGKVPTDAFFSNIGNGNLPVNAVLTGNFIGTNRTGTAAIPNGKSATSTSSGAGGILLFSGVKGATIGGTTTGTGNVIAGNAGAGILVAGSSASPVGVNTIAGNFIGTNSGGSAALGNTKSGISVALGQGIRIASNTISNNGGDGVTVLSGSANTITNNAISSNKLLGIDLGGDGVTQNSATGAPNSKLPNLGQNFPELLSAQVASGKTTVTGLLKGAAKATYRIEFFQNAARDASGYGEGQKFISTTSITADSAGTAKFSATLGVELSGTQFLSMTATDTKGNTSEFSGLARVIRGRVYTTVTDPKNAKATLKQGLANVRVERLDSKGVVKEAIGTDSDGNYFFVGVPDGTWTIKPSSKTGSFDTQFDPATRSVAVSASKPNVSAVDFTTYSLYGVVKDVAGKPLANQTVSLVGFSRSVKTGKDGSYRFEGLGKKQYDVEFGDTFSPKSKIVSLPTSGTAGVSPNAKVDAQQGLSISGFVEDASGKPLANVPIELGGTTISPVVTDKDGRYEFDGLPAATYKVAPKSSAGKFTPPSRSVTLKDKSVDSVDFTKAASTTNAFSGGAS